MEYANDNDTVSNSNAKHTLTATETKGNRRRISANKAGYQVLSLPFNK